jgi:hypothetical protein
VKRGLITVLLALAVALPVATPAAAAPAGLPVPNTLTLRLPDLGPNYELWAEGCDPQPLAGHRSPRALRDLARHARHAGCRIAFGPSWDVPNAPRDPYVESIAFAFADAARPKAALHYGRALATLVLDTDRASLVPLPTASAPIGEEMLVLRRTGFPFGRGYVVAWRSGPILAVVSVLRHPAAATLQAALTLAAAQQARIATPTPLLPADVDDAEVPLDDPRLRLPVIWLGHRLPAGNDRPALTLDGVDLSPYAPQVEMGYGYRGHPDAVNISLSRPAPVRRALRNPRFERLLCLHRYDTRIPGLRAVIFGGPKPSMTARRCGHEPPAVFSAVAFFRHVAVSIDAGACYPCESRSAPFNSPAGLRAILRSLRPREPGSSGEP